MRYSDKNIRFKKTKPLERDMNVVYRLLDNELSFATHDVRAYSLIITLLQENDVVDESVVINICEDKNTAEKLFDVICENRVLPCSVYELLDEIDLSELI